MMANHARSYVAAHEFLVRLATLPVDRTRESWSEIDIEEHAEESTLRNYVRQITADPVLREAIAVASEPAAAALAGLDAGNTVALTDLRRLVRTVTKYLLRACSRTTPFGMFAGVSMGAFDDHAAVRLGRHDGLAVRPDMQWLLSTIKKLEQDPQVCATLTIAANDLCSRRGNRLVLLYAVQQDQSTAPIAEKSVRFTPLLEDILRRASEPVAFRDLVRGTAHAFPSVLPERIEEFIRQLISHDVLLTSLIPRLDCADILGHVLQELASAGDHSAPIRRQLAEIEQVLGRYAWADGSTRQRVRQSMRRLTHSEHVLQIDQLADVDIRLPRAVAEELERAAEVMWRLSPPEGPNPHLQAYHAEFIERFGEAQVPLRELLDTASGLGAPADYRMPDDDRRSHVVTEPTARPTEQSRYLAAVLDHALRSGRQEVVLDDAMISSLESPKPTASPPSIELYAQVHAIDQQALDRGEFRLVLTSASRQPGATLGRFAAALGERAVRALRQYTARIVDSADAIVAQLVFQPPTFRVRNVAQAPLLTSHTVAVGVFADRSDARVLGIDDLAIGADHERLYVVSTRLQAEVVPLHPTMLNTQYLAPNAVRLLQEIPFMTRAPWRPWSWGRLELLPYLPRVRHGRVVLSPARWLPPRDVADPACSWTTWLVRFLAWRRTSGIPDHVYLSSGEQQLLVNLSSRLHQQLVRREICGNPYLSFHESLDTLGTGWVGGHCNEIVVPLLTKPLPRPARRPARTRRNRVEHLPGGEWLYAKVYSARRMHDELLTRHLPGLLDRLPESVDRWFFIRYADPEPHLRLRIHGRVQTLLWEWTNELRQQGLIRAVTLDTYRPEIERYGGPNLMPAAERLFCIDSTAAIELLQWSSQSKAAYAPQVVAAASVVDLLSRLDGPEGPRWLLEHVPRHQQARVPRQQRQELLRLLPQPGHPPTDETLAAIWLRRAEAIVQYGKLVEQGDRTRIFSSLAHMHHNRLIGIDPESEARVQALSRCLVQAHADRLRCGT